MDFNLVVILSFSISIPAIIGWIRYLKINPAYYPFIHCIWIGSLNEIISFTLIQNGYHSSINNNLYALIESLLIVWQFKKWKLFDLSKNLYFLIVSSYIGVWFIEHLIIHDIYYSTSYFRVFYSFVIVLMSINVINRLITEEKENILTNSIFLICIAFVLYYTYYILIMSFWYYGLNFNESFLMKVSSIMPFVNLLSNLLFALAFLWIQPKKRFSLPSLSLL